MMAIAVIVDSSLSIIWQLHDNHADEGEQKHDQHG